MCKKIPLIITFIVAVLMLFGQLFEGPLSESAVALPQVTSRYISSWMTIVSAFVVGLAAISLARTHANKLVQRRANWQNSVILLASFLVFALLRIRVELNPADKGMATNYALIFHSILVPLATTTWALLAFYAAAAAYRAFRIRSIEAGLVLVVATLVLLGQSPLGRQISHKLPLISSWLINVPNLAGQRGLLIGSTIASFISSLRVLLGLEQSHLGVSK